MARSLVVSLALLVLSGCPSPAPEPQPDPQGGFETSRPRPRPPLRLTRKEKLARLLDQKEMPSEQQVRALGAGIDSELADIINNRRVKMHVRIHAVTALGYFQNRRARLMLRGILTDPSWGKPFRMAALVATARSMGGEAYERAKEYTLDADPDMRRAAVQALRVIGSPAALAYLKSLQLRETHPQVLDAIETAIRDLGRSRLEGQ